MAGRIVVGVDGSDVGAAALRWAVEEARLRDATVVAVYAWTFVPSAPIGEPGMMSIPTGDPVGELEAEQRAAEAILDHATSSLPAGTDVESRLVESAPGDALVAAAADAELLVVGSRGRGSLTAALLGSVSHHVVQHAPCPVVVVRG